MRRIAEFQPNINVSDISQVTPHIQNAVMKYTTKHKELFGSYDGELMPRPSKEILEQTNMTFSEFLRNIDADILEPLFICTHTTQGYGHIDEIPALYGLMWMTPNFVLSELKNDKSRKIYILDKGFQFLWEEIARQEALDVKLKHKVSQIYRKYDTSLVSVVYITDCGELARKSFDFLIVSPNMKDVMTCMRFEDIENKIFNKLETHYFTTTLIDHDFSPVRSKSPQDFYVFNIKSKIESTVYGSRDSFASLENIQGDNFQMSMFPDGKDNKTFQTSVFYQLSKNKPRKADLDTHLSTHFKQTLLNQAFNEKADIIARNIWPYFPKFSADDLTSGVLWDILEMQGKFNTWYIGSSVIFESVKSVVEYNLLLMKLFDESNDTCDING